MNRRNFLQSALTGSAAALLRPARMLAALPKMKIKRIRFYQNPLSKTLFNQSFHIVTVETDSGLTGIGEGASRDTVDQCAQMIIGEDPLRIDHLWQVNYRRYFYPPGRHKLHSAGAVDMAEAVHLSPLIEGLEPYFCEDMVRSENPAVYRSLRPQVKVPIAVGEHYGSRWDFNELIENRLIDYSRVTLPNVGGITEYVKIMALCETHYIGLIPHFTC